MAGWAMVLLKAHCKAVEIFCIFKWIFSAGIFIKYLQKIKLNKPEYCNRNWESLVEFATVIFYFEVMLIQ